MQDAIRECRCNDCTQPGDHPSKEEHRRMIAFFRQLDERQRRSYAALESSRIGRGGDRLLSLITGMNVQTIRKGRQELEGSFGQAPASRIRLAPGGQELKKKRDAGSNIVRNPHRGNRRRPDEQTKVGSPELEAPVRVVGEARACFGSENRSSLVGEIGIFLEGQPEAVYRTAPSRSRPPVSLYRPNEEALSSRRIAHNQRRHQEKRAGRRFQECRSRLASESGGGELPRFSPGLAGASKPLWHLRLE
jgi:hypothetical protein